MVRYSIDLDPKGVLIMHHDTSMILSLRILARIYCLRQFVETVAWWRCCAHRHTHGGQIPQFNDCKNVQVVDDDGISKVHESFAHVASLSPLSLWLVDTI